MSGFSTIRRAREDMERAARRYASFTHGNLRGPRYRQREEAREVLRDALAVLDLLRSNTTTAHKSRREERDLVEHSRA